MSVQQIQLCGLLLKDHFGEVIEKVGRFLIKKGPTPLRIIAHDTALKLKQVQCALVILARHNLISIDTNSKRNISSYHFQHEALLLWLRFPRFGYISKTLYGDAAELLVEDMLHSGKCDMSQLVHRVTEKVNQAADAAGQVTIYQVRDHFSSLAQTHFVQRCLDPKLEDLNVNPASQEVLRYHLPPLLVDTKKKRKRSVDDEDGRSAKRHKSQDDDSKPEDDIFWEINFQRFNYHLRDQTLIQAVARKIDKTAGEVVRTMLRCSEVTSDEKAHHTNPLSYHEIFQGLPSELGITKQLLSQYLKLLAEDSSLFIHKAGESGGGMYVINFKVVYTSLCQAHIESVVQERFGSKCLRIFKLLLLKKQLEQKQIEEYAMVPAKETKEMLYRMFSQHFVALTEIPRTPDHAPSRTFYFFSVDLGQVARQMLEHCYKTVHNLICRREHEVKEHKRVLDKQQRLEAILASLDEPSTDPGQKDEIEAMITPTERSQLARVKHMTTMLETSELQVDETIFILKTYLHYSAMK